MTTPVGSIRIDMSIDGSDLWADVATQIAPVLTGLEDLERRLNSIERQYRRTGMESDRASSKQTRGMEAATRAADRLADKYNKVGTAAVQSAALSEAAVDQVTRAWERQTRSIMANTAARAVNAATPTGGPPQGGSVSSFGGGGRGGRGGRYTSGPLGAAVFNAGALAIGSWPALATGVMEVVGGVQQLAQAGLVLPGIFAGAASSIGTAVIGFQGMGDAIKAISEGDLEKIAKATKDMAPAAIETATALSKLTQGPLKDLQKAVAQPMFEGVAQSLEQFSSKVIPRAEKNMVGVAGAWNDTLKKMMEVGGSDSTLSIMDRIFGNTAEGQKRANAAIEPLVKGFGTLAAAGTDTLPRLGDALTKVSTRFSEFITAADGDGRLAKWIDQGLTGIADLGETFLNLGKIITGLTSASGTDDGGFLKWLRESTGALQEFINSAEGQERLGNFFREGREQLAQWGGVLKEIGPILLDIYEASKQWTALLLPALTTMFDLINSMPGGLETLVLGFLAFKTISPFTGLLNQLGQVNTALGATGAGGKGGGILGKLGTLKAVAGGGLAIHGFTDQQQGGVNGGNALELIAGGALLGSAFGPLGVAAGALAGAFATGATAILDAQEQIAQKNRERWDEENTGEEGQRRYNESVAQLPSMQQSPVGNSLRDYVAKNGLPPGLTQAPDGSILGADGRVLLGPLATQGPPVQGPAVAAPPAPAVPAPRVTAAQVPAGGELIAAPYVDAEKDVTGLATAIENLPTGEIKITDPTPEVKQNLEELGTEITQVSENEIVVKADTREVEAQLAALVRKFQSQKIQLQFSAPVGPSAGPVLPVTPSGWFGRATGGVLPGYSPGVDNMLVPMSGGEGVIIPEAMRSLGGNWLYNLNSQFRGGISRRGYAPGGVVGSGGAAMPDDATELGVLKQIRDLLAGNGSGPLSKTADATESLASEVSAASGGKRDPGREMMEAAISALGGDPEKFLPPLVEESVGRATAAMPGALPSGHYIGDGHNHAGEGGATVTGAEGLLPAAAQLAEAVKSAFPQIETIGGVRQDAHPDHPSGRALDIMIPGGTTRGGANPRGKALGDQIWNSLMASGMVDTTGSLWQTDTGGDHYDHIHARIAEGMENAIPGVLGAGMGYGDGSNPLGYSGAPVPVYIVGGPGGGNQLLGDLAGSAVDGAGQALNNVLGAGIPGVLGVGNRALPTTTVGVKELLAERNPNALAAAAGFQVGDYNRTGGAGDPLTTSDGPAYNADGEMFSDTGALLDRTFTSLEAANDARHQQLMDVLSQVRDSLSENMLEPVVQSAVSAGMSELKSSVTTSIGTSLGEAAAPPIASAVASAIPAQAPAAAGGMDGVADGLGAAGQAALGAGFADGGPIVGPGTGTSDSILARLSNGEYVIPARDVRRMGGFAGVDAMRRSLPGFAAGGGVIVNDTVGAEWFGVSQIPIISTIVNLLVQVLLAVLGIQIEARNTLDNISKDFRGFRGDFQAFDASGRLLNDTSALTDRSSTNEQAAVDERVRILKEVISALIQFIIEKIVIPISKAVANTAIQAGAAAAGAAVNTQAPGAGGIVSSLISSAGTAGVDIVADVGGELLVAFYDVLVEGVGDALQSFFPDLLSTVLGGGIEGMFTALFGGILGIFGGAATDSGLFDSGGVARGVGLMPKATLEPERVLSPSNTRSFDQFVAELGSGRGAGKTTTVHAPITMIVDHEQAGERVQNKLLELMS